MSIISYSTFTHSGKGTLSYTWGRHTYPTTVRADAGPGLLYLQQGDSYIIIARSARGSTPPPHDIKKVLGLL